MFMRNLTQRSFLLALALGVFALTTLPAQAAKLKTEDELIAELSGADGKKVAEAMLALERQFPTSTRTQGEIKKFLADSREAVRRKAGRVLGALHAEVSEADLKKIVDMLKATSNPEVMDALKSLRGLKAESALPQIVPLLKSADLGVIRDACRTVAMFGSMANVSDLEPLLQHADPKVQKDAQDAISTLKAK